jgi:glycosyltransferase involved in cell wall biosynthesis
VRIAYVVTRSDSVGGASIHVRDMAQAMLARGHEALVLVGGRGPVTAQLEAASVPYQPLHYLGRPVRPFRDLRGLFELTAALRDFAPDLVSTHTAKAGWLGRAACARLGLPSLYTPHGWPCGDRMPAGPRFFFAAAERAASRWGNLIICVSERERELALARRLAPPARLTVIHNGVRDVGPEFRADAAAGPVRIVCVARLDKPKDHATLLAALAGLESLDWDLDLIGEGPLEGRLRALARSLGISSRVRFSGYLPDPAAALARAQLFVLASRSEGFPRSVLEAMRAGLPVVASDVGGVKEAVDRGENGLLVPPGDARALASALEWYIAGPESRCRSGALGRRTYERRFTLERMVEQTLAAYKTLVSG